MVSQHEVDFMNMKIEQLEKAWAKINKNYDARGKALNKLWEKNKDLKKQIVTIQKALGSIYFNIGKLETENRLIIPAKNKDLPGMQILVRDLVKQLISESGYELEFKVLQKKETPTLTVSGKEIK